MGFRWREANWSFKKHCAFYEFKYDVSYVVRKCSCATFLRVYWRHCSHSQPPTLHSALNNCTIACFLSISIWGLQDYRPSDGSFHVDKQRWIRSHRWDKTQSRDRNAKSSDIYSKQHQGSNALSRPDCGHWTQLNCKTKRACDETSKYSCGRLGVWRNSNNLIRQQYNKLLRKGSSNVHSIDTIYICAIKHYLDSAVNRILLVSTRHICHDRPS